MTGQISDSFLYNGEEYSLVGIDGDELFEPLSFDIETIPASTDVGGVFKLFTELLENI